MRLHNFASIVEDKTVAQAQLVADLPFVYPHVALMPDATLAKALRSAPSSARCAPSSRRLSAWTSAAE